MYSVLQTTPDIFNVFLQVTCPVYVQGRDRYLELFLESEGKENKKQI